MSSPVIFNNLSLDAHVFTVRAVDNGGIEDPTPAMQTWTVTPGAPSPKSRTTKHGSGNTAPGSGSAAAFRAGAAAFAEAAAFGAVPADALLTRISDPAVDEDGNVAFPAKWANASGGKGRGIFNAFGSIAEVGGSVPGVAGATFATLAAPVLEGGYVAFLGTIAGVSAGKAAAVFSDAPTGTLDMVARAGDVAPARTIKGGGVRGLAKRTLWWQPPGGILTLLAQGGTEPADIPGAQWESFTSLAIAGGRGPIFTASLVVGAGGVTKKNATGVWAVDSAGALQLIFRTGDEFGGKTVRRFDVIEAVSGSVGSTRSFNDRGAVIWLATFSDQTQTIIATTIE